MNERIAAVVVTFNRKELLLECLRGLMSQTRPLDKIYLIDNASSDGTSQALKEAGYLDSSVIEYVVLQTNTGGAGGFFEGVKRAHTDGYDWLWLMDDDVEPTKDGLERLLEFRKVSECIHGRRIDANGTPFQWGYKFDPYRVSTKPLENSSFANGENYYELNVGCFEGMLVSRRVVDCIGYPLAEFFIALDDVYYGYLASKVTKVIYANVFSLIRKRQINQYYIGAKQVIPLSNLALAYSHRNRFLIAAKENGIGLPFILETIRAFAAAAIRELIFNKSFAQLVVVFKGINDGIIFYRNNRIQR